jgi:transcriptional regulator with XRE-family HTH domain
MFIGGRLRKVRQQKGLSQGDLEKASGLLRCYISRVENGHTLPSIETLEKFAAALDVPLYELFYEGEGPLQLTDRQALWELAHEPGAEQAEARFLLRVKQLAAGLGESDRSLLLDVAARLAGRSKRQGRTRL